MKEVLIEETFKRNYRKKATIMEQMLSAAPKMIETRNNDKQNCRNNDKQNCRAQLIKASLP